MDHEKLMDAVRNGAAFRRRQRLQPVGGAGDKVFPPTYPGPGSNDPAQHVFEDRRVAEEDKPVSCVLIDSVQSQANRLEEALLLAIQAGEIELPHVATDIVFPKEMKDTAEEAGYELVDPGRITSLETPHRVFDAILRDSEKDKTPFNETEVGKRLQKATMRNATAVLELSPNSLLFGAWNSTGTGGGLGAKFQRCVVSEIIGYGAVVGKRTSSRIDPLGVQKGANIYGTKSEWIHEPRTTKDKPVRPSEVNHGNIRPDVEDLGVTFEYAEQCAVVTLAGLRHFRFGGDAARDEAARTYLAALGLYALAANDKAGYSLRSRCDLVADEETGPAPIELIGANGKPETVSLDNAKALYAAALDTARQAGFDLNAEPLLLVPQAKLLEIVRGSQEMAWKGQGTDDNEE
ncbi:MAG: type I-U CRISPR-associated RAMP protein Csb1/Cas7u [Pseudomonadota bacterium]